MGAARRPATSCPRRSRPKWSAAPTGAGCSRPRSTCRRPRRGGTMRIRLDRRGRPGCVARQRRSSRSRPAAGCAPKRRRRSRPAVTVSRPVEQPIIEYTELTGTVAASKTVNLMARVAGLPRVGQLQGRRRRRGGSAPLRHRAGALRRAGEAERGGARAGAGRARPAAGDDEGERDGARRPSRTGSASATRRRRSSSWRRSTSDTRRSRRPSRDGIGRAAGGPGQPRRHRRPDPARDARAAPADLRQLQPERARRAPPARPDAPNTRSRSGRTSARRRSRSASRTRRATRTSASSTSPTTRSRTSTGTIALRGIFENEDTTLFPGLFARVRAPAGRAAAHARHSRQRDRQRPAGRLRLRRRPGRRRGAAVDRRGPITASGLAIRSGLAESDRVIVNGLLNARAGEKVAPTEATPVPAPAPRR